MAGWERAGVRACGRASGVRECGRAGVRARGRAGVRAGGLGKKGGLLRVVEFFGIMEDEGVGSESGEFRACLSMSLEHVWFAARTDRGRVLQPAPPLLELGREHPDSAPGGGGGEGGGGGGVGRVYTLTSACGPFAHRYVN